MDFTQRYERAEKKDSESKGTCDLIPEPHVKNRACWCWTPVSEKVIDKQSQA